MKIFSSEQIKQIDETTIRNEPVHSIDLMERAAGKLADWYIGRFERSQPLIIVAGPGNNGGDGLALARLLSKEGYEPEVRYIKFTSKQSEEWKINSDRLRKETKVPFITISRIEQFKEITPGTIIIDAIFGSGLSRPADGLASEVIRKINSSGSAVVAVDIPSGLFCGDNSSNDPDTIIRADYTLTFQFPKLSFMFPENEKFTGCWFILPIGLDKKVIDNTETPFIYAEPGQVKALLKNRRRFDHKGSFGHGLLIGGSYGKMGAVVLGARAAMRTGIGLVTCHIPSCGDQILQGSVPEAMAEHDKSEKFISEIINTGRFDAAGIGPGIGTLNETSIALHRFLQEFKKPLVIDADALNILSENKSWFELLTPGTVITPHPKEFERLAGKTSSGYERLQRQIEFSAKHNCIVVLKGANTSISVPDGRVWFNSTGNPGMATAGSGDLLTGMILSLLAQGYNPENSAVIAVYLHGLAGDITAEKSCYESVIASDIVENIGEAFNRIKSNGLR
jgi:hydroxyethylthiazole kinase-like uncharacterized protein yjeF